jgi:hypothetical protein
MTPPHDPPPALPPLPSERAFVVQVSASTSPSLGA